MYLILREALVPIFSFTKKKGMDIGTCPFMTDPVCMHRKLTVTAATETVRTEVLRFTALHT